MIFDDLRDDPWLEALSGLQRPEPDPARTARVRSRCRAALGRRRAPALVGEVVRRVLAPALIAVGGTAYLAEVLRRAAALLGL